MGTARAWPGACSSPPSQHLTFRARLRGRPLRAGRYRLVLGATDAAGNRSAARRLAFTVVAGS
jgi:hypothetical protein